LHVLRITSRMSESVAAAQVVAEVKAKTPKKKAPTAKAAKKPTDHPKYSEMVQQALTTLKERGGSSRQAILKYIIKNFKVGSDENIVNTHLKMALRAGVKNASLKQSKGTGAAGSFRLGEEAKKAKTVKKTKVAAAATASKKPAKAKSATGVKSPKKVVKKAAAVAKKPTKAAAEKPAKKAKADKPKKAVAAAPKKAAAAAKVTAPKKAAPKRAAPKADKPKKTAASPAKKAKPAAAAKKPATPKAKKATAAKKA